LFTDVLATERLRFFRGNNRLCFNNLAHRVGFSSEERTNPAIGT
jgi:hypothetical protein